MPHSIAMAVHNLTVAYDRKPVLWDLTMEVPSGTLAAIVGPNGAGKSTLIKTALGLIKPVAGRVVFPVLGSGAIANKIAYVPQSSSVDWDFPATVLDVVMMGRYGHLGWCKRPGKKERTMAMETLETVGMEPYHARQISQLSGGQQQRVFLARALVQQGEIYCMDEPFKGVDLQTEKSIIQLLKQLKSQGKTVIIVHHDLYTVPAYFDWVTLLNGTCIANGSVASTFTPKNIEKTYGSNGFFNTEDLPWNT